jgi:squalene-hopene/tetraprenyl-beta-curcumene cyclase
MAKRGRILVLAGAAALAVALAVHMDARPFANTAGVESRTDTVSWNPRMAARYLDERQSSWQSWPKAARDRGTVCVSCHTALPYALVRPELRALLHGSEVAAPERKLLADVLTRVRAWGEVKPFYGDTTATGRTRAIQSRGTEAVLNALILASHDHREGVASTDARVAFANLFALQVTDGEQAGSWPWLDFHLRPWESTSARYFGAALAAIAVGTEPQGYVETPAIQPDVDRLRRYLRSHTSQPIWNRLLRREDDPNLFNRAMLLWASTKLGGLLSPEERKPIVAELYHAQASDGSWKLESLGYWRPAKGVRTEVAGDGYATGLVAYALQQAGITPNESHVGRALAWLRVHQDPATGKWNASSLNKQRDPRSNVGKFMSDAATAFAVLALTKSQQ